MRKSLIQIFSTNSLTCRGQAMVEFLIVLPVMLLLVMGIIQFALIYKAKSTLNYATFQTVRTGTLNHASMSAMETAFDSNMAPLYTTSYLSMASGNTDDCTSSFINTDAGRTNRIGTAQIMEDGLRGVLDKNIDTKFSSKNVLCARRRVKDQREAGFARISVVNPISPDSFTNFGVMAYYDGNDSMELMIPNDNLMYRDRVVKGSGETAQSVQDANLLKVHVGYCYELIIPFINRVVWAMQRWGPGTAPDSEIMFGNYWADPNSTPPYFFGPPPAGSFAEQCIVTGGNAGRFGITLYSQGIMRMQSAAVECELTDSC